MSNAFGGKGRGPRDDQIVHVDLLVDLTPLNRPRALAADLRRISLLTRCTP